MRNHVDRHATAWPAYADHTLLKDWAVTGERRRNRGTPRTGRDRDRLVHWKDVENGRSLHPPDIYPLLSEGNQRDQSLF